MIGTRMHRKVRPRGAQPVTWANVEVEIVDDSTGCAATMKETPMRRLGELHRLLNRETQRYLQEKHRREWQNP